MFDNYHFDLANVLVGILVGFVVAFLIRMSALKKLDLKLNKIGLDLGIDGFEPEQRAGVRTGDISGQVHGDIVGGDKTVSTSNFFDKLQTSVQQVVGGGRGIRQRRRHSFRWESRDSAFTSQLKDIARSHRDDWTREWIDHCLSHPDCRRLIRQEIERCRTDGWQPVAIDFDNHGDGVHVNLESESEYVPS
jgi:hypothetical protein